VVATPPCVVNGTGGSGGGPTPIDAGPAPDDGGTSGGPIIQDGGAPAPDDASCPTTPPPPDPGFDGGTGSLCGACPAGWKSDPTQPEVCCTTTADGTNECFSQASGPVGSIGLDGGSGPPTVTPVGPPGWGTSSGPGTNGPSCTGTTGSSCSCEQSTGGHAYALDCYPDSSGIFQCTCSVDKASQSTFASKDPTYCNDSSQIEPAFTAPTGCNFP
jgi:hypothetical protein